MRDPADIFAGKQLRFFRLLRGKTQTDLANALNISFQQIQKYETGANRISVSRLSYICKLLKVTPAEFFEQADQEVLDGSPTPQETALIAAYRKSNPSMRQSLLSLVNLATESVA